MKHPHRLNRFATVAMIPLVAVGFFVAMRALNAQSSAPPFEPEGLLIQANLRDESLTFFDFVAGERIDVALAGSPHEMAHVDGALFVTLGRHDALAQVDVATREVERYLVLKGAPHGIAADGDRLYVTLDDADTVVVLDVATLAEVARFETGDTPHAVALSGETVFVTNSRDGTISAISNGGTVTRDAGALPESIAVYGPASLAVANADDGTIALFALPGLEQAAVYALEGRPVRIVPFEDLLLVSRGRTGDLVVLDPGGGGLRATVPVGRLIDGACVAPSGTWVAASSNGDNRLRIISTEEWAVSMDYDTADGPGACLWLGVD